MSEQAEKYLKNIESNADFETSEGWTSLTDIDEAYEDKFLPRIATLLESYHTRRKEEEEEEQGRWPLDREGFIKSLDEWAKSRGLFPNQRTRSIIEQNKEAYKDWNPTPHPIEVKPPEQSGPLLGEKPKRKIVDIAKAVNSIDIRRCTNCGLLTHGKPCVKGCDEYDDLKPKHMTFPLQEKEEPRTPEIAKAFVEGELDAHDLIDQNTTPTEYAEIFANLILTRYINSCK